MRHLFAVLVVLLLQPAQAQTPADGQRTDFEPADTTTLRGFLPERFGAYTFDQASVPPFGQEERTDLNAVYEAEDGRALFVVLSHVPPGTRPMQEVGISETAFHGYPAFEETSVPRLTVHVGETVDVVAYGVEGDVPVEDLYAALEALDGKGIEAFAAADVEPVAEAEPVAESEPAMETEAISPPPVTPEPAERTTPAPAQSGEHREGCAFNEAYTAEVMREFSVRLAPWAKAITPEQAMAAEIGDEHLTFPREGNPWLDCVTVNDLLWAPQAPDYGHVFLRRVLAIEERPGAVVLRTRNAGLDELIFQGRIEVEASDEEEQ